MVNTFCHSFSPLQFLFLSDQTKDLENLNQTLQKRCDQLQTELMSLRERLAQGYHLSEKESSIFLFISSLL